MGKLRQLALSRRYDLLFWCFAIALIPKFSFASDDFYKDKWRIESAVQKTYENGTKTVEIKARKSITINGSYREYTGRANIVPAYQNVGRTMFRRLFIRRALPLLGIVALSSMLKGDGFTIDFDNEKIYYPEKTNNTEYSVSPTKGYANTPYDACNLAFGIRAAESSYSNNPPSNLLCYSYEDFLASIYSKSGKYLGGMPPKLQTGDLAHNDYITGNYYGYGTDKIQWSVSSAVTRENQSEPRKELSPEDLGRYAMGTLPNYEKNNWTSVTDAFIPQDEYEIENNPNYTIADQSIREDSTDTSVKPIPDNSGGSSGNNGFSLPNFCDWATPICSFIDWFKDDSTIPDDPSYKVDELDKAKLPDGPQFSLNASCPPPASFSLDLGLVSKNIDIPYTSLCNFSTDARPFVILAAWFHAAFIFAGLFRS